LMSALRNAINAYAADGAEPDAVLARVGRLVDVARDGRFATVLCGTIDLPTGQVVIANAGHPPPLLITAERCEAIPTVVGPPVGVGHHYTPVQVTMPGGATLLAYTDGLIERRGEPISAGLARLCAAAEGGGPLEEVLDGIFAALIPSGPHDDTAAVGIRWHG
jgi:serine phosphatase RsbU (regulator of sigma subunit)